MALYLDASILVAVHEDEATRPLFADLFTEREIVLISDFAVAETSGALMTLWRTDRRSKVMIQTELSRLDEWVSGIADRVPISPDDVADATQFVRNTATALRAPDAIHIAAARRLESTLLTLDRGMARAAAMLGVACINPTDATTNRKT